MPDSSPTLNTKHSTLCYRPGFWQTIPGWFDYQELYDLAVAEAQDGADFLEIGAWLGRSTCYLAEAVLLSGKDTRITVVDTFCGVPDDELQPLLEPLGGSVHEAFRDNMKQSGLFTFLDVLVEDSRAAHTQFPDSSLDFVFIDGDHSYDGVRRDIINWLPKVRIGGIFAGHDYGHSAQVRQAVDELLGPCAASAASWMYRPS